MNAPRYRHCPFGQPELTVRNADGGVQYVQANEPLEDYPRTLTDRLKHWATVAPDRTVFARREQLAGGGTGDWIRVSYAEALQAARAIAQALLNRGLNEQWPVLILSENDLEHALLTLGCLYAGVPYCATSPAYSLLSTDYGKLKHVVNTLKPGLIFASHGGRYGAALKAAAPDGCEIALTTIADFSMPARDVIAFDQLRHTQATAQVDEAQARIQPDDVAKFLFTSGSTKLPKAVINTHRMWCANQQQISQSIPVVRPDAAGNGPVLVDWLPWNHTFGGNHNFGLILNNGGTLYIDDGKPTPLGMAETLRNLREVSPTVYFNVPTGFEAIAHAMQTDDVLRRTWLARLSMCFYAGASLAQPIWDALHSAQEREVGERIVMCTGMGMTESSPFALSVNRPDVRAGDLGIPTPGLTIKLVPMGDKVELRYRGPNITPGYWRDAATTAEAFDDEGFFHSGDAVAWVDPTRPELGLRFDGRIAEDFKLATGTFVSVGPLRGKLIAAASPYAQDAVITGLNMHEVGAMVFPTAKVRDLAALPPQASMAEVLAAPAVLAHFQRVVDTLASTATGSANRIARLCLLAEPPSIDVGEVTDKGSINQRAVLKHRDAIVQALHDGTLPNALSPKAA